MTAPDAAALDALIADLGDPGLRVNSLMVRHRGAIVAEHWWAGCDADLPHEMYSVTKTITAIAVGMAIEDGLLSVDEPLRGFFGDEGAGIDERVTLAHLLTMTSGRTGQEDDVRFLTRDESVARYASLPQQTEAGTVFSYCSLTSHILSLALGARTGCRLYDYVGPRLFALLGIRPPAWQTDLEGNQIGGTGLSLRTGELARLGVLLLGGGVFEGTRLFSEDWHTAMTTAHADTAFETEDRPEWKQGYGYQLWCGLHDTYRADGMLGQFAIVAPERDLVVAVTARSSRTDLILARIADRLLDPSVQSPTQRSTASA